MVVVGRGQVPGIVSSMAVVVVAVAVTCHRVVVVVMVMVMEKIMTRIQTQFLGLILGPGRTQGYV